MYTINFKDIELSARSLEEIAKQEITLADLTMSYIQGLAKSKYSEAMELPKQKMYSKIIRKLEDATDSVELSDEQFDFVFDLISAPIAPNTFIAPFAELLEKLKLANK